MKRWLRVPDESVMMVMIMEIIISSWEGELRTRCIVCLVLHAASEDDAGQGVRQLSPGDITFRYITCVDTKRSSKWWNRFILTCYQVFEGSQVCCLLWDLQDWRGTLLAPRPLPHPVAKSCRQAKIAFMNKKSSDLLCQNDSDVRRPPEHIYARHPTAWNRRPCEET